jgi:two-component system chemotaxis response regulator CheY
MINLDDELALDYLSESRTHLTDIEMDLLALEAGGPEFDGELIDRVFRAVHTIKGGAGFFDLANVRELAHQAEDVLTRIRSREMSPTPDTVHILLRATDTLRALILDPAVSNQVDIREIMTALSGLRPDAHRAPPATQKGRLRILLVEDDFSSRLLLQTFLSHYGECHVAVNGREAVDAFRSALEQGQGYQLICMDIMMPEMDGREAVHRVRAIEEARGIRSTQGAKIIMTTAVNEVREVIKCFQELCDAYVMKPIDLTQLLGHMKSYQLIQ